ncbi:MAG: TIGR01777 family oxidoreductase [Anaerolineaceae bacterium]|nr:TIGR01777 family oxidoreductase [Anaerolineaceae bacterium]
MRVLIAGGSGLIGRALANSLAADDHEVIVLSRSPALAQGLGPRVQVEGWDARSAEGWGKLADGADAIVNLAGASIAGEGFLPARWTAERKRLIRDSRVNAGAAICEAIEQAEKRPSVLVQSSAVGYYGTHSADVDVTEDSPAGNDWLAQVCLDWEGSTAPVEAMGVRRAVIRTGIVLSFEGGALQRMALPFRMFAGGPLGNGRQPFPWIHPADQVGAIRYLLRHSGAAGAFNLAAPVPLTNAQFSRELGAVLRRPSLLPVPGFLFRAMFGEVAMVVLEGQWALPQRLLELGYTFRFREAGPALANLAQAAG